MAELVFSTNSEIVDGGAPIVVPSASAASAAAASAWGSSGAEAAEKEGEEDTEG